MKVSKIAFSTFAAVAIFAIGCATTQKTVSEESIGLRKTDLYTESTTVADKTNYRKDPAGASTKIERAFENAPPMIPHDTEGFLPITVDNNMCLQCHEPAVAPGAGATPIPKSHFTNFRPDTVLNKKGKIVKEGIVVENTSDIKTVAKSKDILVGARFNCSQCHAPQSQGEAPKNNFTTEFRQKDSVSKSNLLDVINEGVE